MKKEQNKSDNNCFDTERLQKRIDHLNEHPEEQRKFNPDEFKPGGAGNWEVVDNSTEFNKQSKGFPLIVGTAGEDPGDENDFKKMWWDAIGGNPQALMKANGTKITLDGIKTLDNKPVRLSDESGQWVSGKDYFHKHYTMGTDAYDKPQSDYPGLTREKIRIAINEVFSDEKFQSLVAKTQPIQHNYNESLQTANDDMLADLEKQETTLPEPPMGKGIYHQMRERGENIPTLEMLKEFYKRKYGKTE